MERIFVTYRPVQGTGELIYHMSLNYIDDKSRHHIIDGGPENTPEGFKVLQGTYSEHFKSPPEQNTDSPFGRLVMTDPYSEDLRVHKEKIYTGGRILKPYTHIAKGKNLSSIWQTFLTTAQAIDGRYEYRPSKQNSNTFISVILKRNGFNKLLGAADRGLSDDHFQDDTLHQNADPDRHIKLNIPGSNTTPNNPLPFKSSNLFSRSDVRDTDNKIFNNVNENESTPLSRVQLAAPRPTGPSRVLDNRLLGPVEMPQKGPERVKRDPAYNPFNRDKNGFEDLDGEVYVWKKGKTVRNRMIREAGRADFFGIDEEVA